MIYLGFCIVVLTTYIGYCFSKKLVKRKTFLNDFYNFNQKIKREVGFSKKPILSILEEENTDFSGLLKDAILTDKEERPNYLIKDDYDLFINYKNFLGTSDSKSQINYFNTINESIKKLLETAKANEEKLKPLYLKLGFFVGLTILIILI
ncbi:MAG: stage III sporulation protein AB [Clostridia bacterium]|nr:stage III sporulation protein AB [Clostridia bacterium]